MSISRVPVTMCIARSAAVEAGYEELQYRTGQHAYRQEDESKNDISRGTAFFVCRCLVSEIKTFHCAVNGCSKQMFEIFKRGNYPRSVYFVIGADILSVAGMIRYRGTLKYGLQITSEISCKPTARPPPRCDTGVLYDARNPLPCSRYGSAPNLSNTFTRRASRFKEQLIGIPCIYSIRSLLVTCTCRGSVTY